MKPFSTLFVLDFHSKDNEKALLFIRDMEREFQKVLNRHASVVDGELSYPLIEADEKTLDDKNFKW